MTPIPLDANVYQAGFDAAWELDIFGGTRRAVEAATADIAAAEFGRCEVLVPLYGAHRGGIIGPVPKILFDW